MQVVTGQYDTALYDRKVLDGRQLAVSHKSPARDTTLAGYLKGIRLMKKIALVLLMSGSTAATSFAQHGRPEDVQTRAKGAQKVVVATVMSVTPTFETNKWGDRLIVSHADLKVEESLKGNAAQVLSLDVEGGTVGGLTLTVSDMEAIAPGERGVFFVDETRPGTHVPHHRGNGILKLDKAGRVNDSNVTLDDVKRQVREGQK
jgi:hypothetical protein